MNFPVQVGLSFIGIAAIGSFVIGVILLMIKLKIETEAVLVATGLFIAVALTTLVVMVRRTS